MICKVVHQEVLNLAAQIAPDLDDSLFDEVSQLNIILSEIDTKELDSMSPNEKWKRIFKANLPGLYIIVSKILSIPVSNAFVERVFSLCTAQWTDQRNLLHVETVKSLVQVKVNYNLDCPQMYNLLISSPKLLKQIMGSEKYDV